MSFRTASFGTILPFPPCGKGENQDCSERHVGCHSTCEKYKEWQKECLERKSKAYKSGDYLVLKYQIDTASKSREKWERKKGK